MEESIVNNLFKLVIGILAIVVAIAMYMKQKRDSNPVSAADITKHIDKNGVANYLLDPMITFKSIMENRTSNEMDAVYKMLSERSSGPSQLHSWLAEFEKMLIALRNEEIDQVSAEKKNEAATKLIDGDTALATLVFNDQLQHQQGSALHQKKAKLHSFLGALAYVRKEPEAIEHIRQATVLDADQPQSWNLLGLLLVAKGCVTEAKQAYDQAQQQLIDTDDTMNLKALVFGNLAEAHRAYGEIPQAIDAIRRSFALNTTLSNKPGLAGDHLALTTLSLFAGQLDQACAHCTKSFSLNLELGDVNGVAGNYNDAGVIHQNLGEMDKAVVMYEISLSLYSQMNHKRSIAMLNGNLGYNYYLVGALDKAEPILEKTLALYTELDNKEGLAGSLTNLGLVKLALGDLDKTLELYEQSLALFIELDSKEAMAAQYCNMVDVLHRRGDLDRALEVGKKALAIDTDLGNMPGMARDYANIGFVHQARLETEQAINCWRRSENLFAELGSPQVSTIQGWIKNPEAASLAG